VRANREPTTGQQEPSPLGRWRWRPTPVHSGLLAVVTAAATTAALLSAGSANTAFAYTQDYNCETFVGQSTCHLTAGSWHNITNIGATNYDVAGDICAQYGQLSATYTCASSGYTLLLCSSTVYQYGISETLYGDNDNISGHEDDNTNCS
jgi:hypothetical protein